MMDYRCMFSTSDRHRKLNQLRWQNMSAHLTNETSYWLKKLLMHLNWAIYNARDLNIDPHACFFPTVSQDRARPIPSAQPEACPQRSERPICARSPHRSRNGYPGWLLSDELHIRKWGPFDAMLIFVHQARCLSGTRPSANHADCVPGHRNQIYHELTKESEGTCRTLMPIFSSAFVQFSWISHLPLDKMAAISQTTYSNAFFYERQVLYFDSNFTEVCSHGSNWSPLVQLMAWRRTGDKPLPEPMLSQFTDAHMQH